MNATPLEKMLSAIGDYRRSGKSYKARCPAHEDNSPSLSISVAEDGRGLLKCHAGCSTEAIVSALGLEMRDLFPRADVDTTPKDSRKTPVPSTARGGRKTFPSAASAVADLEKHLGKRSAIWTYHDANAQPVGVIIRWDNDSGKVIRPVAKIGSGWVQGGMPTPRPLYRLPELLQSTGPVYVVEGEKAADALHALGFTVTTSAHGANSARGTDWMPLAGRDVLILPDNDDAGAGYAEAVIDLLGKLTPRPSIRIVNLPGLPVGGDAVEFIAERRAVGLNDAAIRAEVERLSGDAERVEPKSEEPPITPIIVCLADVQPRPVEWLWPGRIALGKVTLIAGDPGLGKSFVTLDIAAKVSCGAAWPDSPGIKTIAGGVVLLSAEDDAEDTIRPRLDAAGADVQRIKALLAVRRAYKDDPTKESTFSLETDLPALEAAILATPGCRLVIIDPITAYLGRTDSHKNADIRGLIAPLAALAAKHRIAIVCVTHLNKSGNGPAIYRSIGSIAFVAAARAVWAVTKDKDNPQRRLMLPAKNNLAPDALGLAYSLEPYGTNGTAVVCWERDPVDMSADDAMQADTGKDNAEDGNQAQAWLREALKDSPMPAADVFAQGKANGFPEKMIRRGFHDLGGHRKKADFKGGWLWWLPSAEDAHHPQGESSTSWESSQKHAESSSASGSQDAQNFKAFSEDSQDAQDSEHGPRQGTLGDDYTEWEDVK